MGSGKKWEMLVEQAVIARALGNPGRLELLDLLAQGPRSVDDLATTAEMGVSTCSAHLQVLREAGLVTSVREGKRVLSSLTDNDVAQLLLDVRTVALRHRPAAERAARAFLGPDDTQAVTREELLHRAASGSVVVVDVRPGSEYRAGHLPGAINIPLSELASRLNELPVDIEVVAYCRGALCVLSHDAVRLLHDRGFRARRAKDGVLEWRAQGLLTNPDTAGATTS